MPGSAATDGGGVVLVHRGELVESRHEVRVAIADTSGALRLSLGNPSETVFLRSSAKPFQAAAALAAGAFDRFSLTDEELAVVCSSHSGEDVHVRLVSGMLARMGLDAGALRCGTHAPLDPPTAARHGSKLSPLHNNCSGKHAGMLALALHLGSAVDSYLDPQGPVQRRILATVAEACGLDPQSMAVATDGCGAPIFAVPLLAAARAYSRLARPADVPEPFGSALTRIARAMSSHPHLVAGTGRFDTALMKAAGGGLVAKSGAEAVQGIALPAEGLGLFLKVVDGNARAAGPAVLESLRLAGLIAPATLDALRAHWQPEVRNHAGQVVGRIRAGIRFASADSG